MKAPTVTVTVQTYSPHVDVFTDATTTVTEAGTLFIWGGFGPLAAYAPRAWKRVTYEYSPQDAVLQ